MYPLIYSLIAHMQTKVCSDPPSNVFSYTSSSLLFFSLLSLLSAPRHKQTNNGGAGPGSPMDKSLPQHPLRPKSQNQSTGNETVQQKQEVQDDSQSGDCRQSNENR